MDLPHCSAGAKIVRAEGPPVKHRRDRIACVRILASGKEAMVGIFKRLFGAQNDQAGHASAMRPANGQGGMPDGMPASIEQGMEWQAADFVNAFSPAGSPIDGSKLDYSEASLELVDRVLDDFYRKEAPLPDDLHFLISAYVFEVARRAFGGRYLRGDEENPFVLVIGEKPAEVGVCVMSKVHGRALNGPEDGIPFFYAGIAPLVSAGTSATLI
ncbi:hypothetical protein E5A73_17215 [Sphingomonas gei]|uniref:Uncharacterized protein n=1 Tax=Sphingomonas gei TaxID=1395960 RepID=A0A4V3QYF8_9SPHN|nr:hypothetical protein E5A73_17215 [Sphingomonas gei]